MHFTTLAKNELTVLPTVHCKQLVIEDELEEASIYQRIETIDNRLFDEYRSELLTYKQEISAPRRYS